MIVRELLTLVGYKVDERSEDQTRNSFLAMKSAATLAARVINGAIIDGLTNMVSLASDANEVMNVITATFKDQSDVVLDWAKVQSEALGRSETQLQNYAAELGKIIAPTIGSEEAAAKMSTRLATLAVNMASFNNETEADTIAALRAGLIGSTEPLQRFGVVMNVAALDAFALARGLGKTTSKMNDAEKTALRYQFILAKTSNQQGDAVSTAGSYANMVKRLEGLMLDIQVTIGKALLPVAIELLQTFIDTAKAIRGPLSIAIDVIGSNLRFLSALVQGLILGVRQLPTDLKIMSAAFIAALTVILAPGAVVIGLIGLIGVAVAILIQDLWKMLTDGGGVIGGMVDEFKYWLSETDSILDAIGQLIKQAVDWWAETLFGIPNATEKVTAAWEEMTSGITGFIDQVDEAILQLEIDIRSVVNRIVNFLTESFDLGMKNARETLAFFTTTAQKLGGFFTDIGPGFGGAQGRLAAEQGGGGRVVNAPQSIEVTVNAPGGNGPEIAAAVAPAVGRAAGDSNRRVAQQLLAGGGA